MLRTLDYQDRVLKALDAYLDVLNAEKAKADKVAELVAANPDVEITIPDFAEKAWGRIKRPRADKVPYDPRHDGAGRPVPDVVLKVPTGGGKTLLASYGLSRVFGRYLNRTTGFVLWIVPNEAIYSQTLKALSDRQHPYRQVLDRIAAGRVKIMEKTDRLDARDVEGQLPVRLCAVFAVGQLKPARHDATGGPYSAPAAGAQDGGGGIGRMLHHHPPCRNGDGSAGGQGRA